MFTLRQATSRPSTRTFGANILANQRERPGTSIGTPTSVGLSDPRTACLSKTGSAETKNELRSPFLPTKFCIFCGGKPVENAREHVLPQWLIAVTGDPQRQGMFGIDWTKKPPVKRS